MDQKLGVKSYSFRTISDLNELAKAIKRCDTSEVDLSACHVNYDDPANQEKIIQTFRSEGVNICGIGVVQARNDEAFNLRYFKFAQMAGCKVISCTFPPEDHEATLKILEKLASQFGFLVAIHNHGGKHWMGNSTILKYLFQRTGPEIGLCLDTAWALQSGENPTEWLELFHQRLYGIHFKDFEFNRKGKHLDTIVGSGSLDLPAFVARLKSIPMTGSVVVEYEGKDPIEASAQCVKAIRSAWAAHQSNQASQLVNS